MQCESHKCDEQQIFTDAVPHLYSPYRLCTYTQYSGRGGEYRLAS
jgi:hypothetical protein